MRCALVLVRQRAPGSRRRASTLPDDNGDLVVVRENTEGCTRGP